MSSTPQVPDPRRKTPSFIAEFPAAVSAATAYELAVRLDAARQVYNACLGEALRRREQVRSSEIWRAAGAMPKGLKSSKESKARVTAFESANEDFGFTSASIQKFAESCRDACWIGEHLGSHDTQTTSLRAFKAAQQYAFGKRGRPRFKGKGRFNSIEGKTDAVIVFRWVDRRPAVRYLGLTLPLVLDPRDKDGWQRQALEHRTKYVRIVRRRMHGKDRWRVQLVQEGRSPRKSWQKPGQDTIGVDLGPSVIAAVSGTEATLEPFCPGVVDFEKEARVIQRAMDRSRRATNRECFNPNGTFKAGAKIKVRSHRYRVHRDRRAETERKLAAERKRAHGELVNRILAQAEVVKLESFPIVPCNDASAAASSAARREPSSRCSSARLKAPAFGSSRSLPTRRACPSTATTPASTRRSLCPRGGTCLPTARRFRGTCTRGIWRVLWSTIPSMRASALRTGRLPNSY